MPAPGQQPQEPLGLVAIARLAKDASPDSHDRIGGKDDVPLRAGDGLRLFPREPDRVMTGKFAALWGLVDFRCFDGIRQNADLRKQIPTPWTC